MDQFFSVNRQKKVFANKIGLKYHQIEVYKLYEEKKNRVVAISRITA